MSNGNSDLTKEDDGSSNPNYDLPQDHYSLTHSLYVLALFFACTRNTTTVG